MVLAELIAELRDHNPKSDASITLDDLLDGVRVAAYGLSDDEVEDLIDTARDEVPKYYGGDPNRQE